MQNINAVITAIIINNTRSLASLQRVDQKIYNSTQWRLQYKRTQKVSFGSGQNPFTKTF